MKTIYVTVKVDYSAPQEMRMDKAQSIAEWLAIRPDYSSTIEGVQLQDVEVRFVDEIE